ncbi:DNA-binding transcriptional LysR family regulator [Tamaricihabitans halophyticus]|uniref:DNA-binding transcriptional LysR family regulator n=1 Tax=Tamaricihabitans halophyticus TaxID=1262583 RepID=A0A4R2QPC0_9PSEU|nr:LysR family transcriptional regulator [Tamaricihabitans halophyticus]TCP50779.1 DNA-binding transcriptional LysR family regulator [Tamaricihabitans halophyticus]
MPAGPATKPLHLKTFHEVYRGGSFAIAARNLGYTASAVSQQISALEKDTGLTLFERAAHSIRPTTAAHQLIELSRHLLATLDDFHHEIHELATGAIGRLRLGSFPTAGVRLVPAALAAFTAAHPRAEVALEEDEPATLLDAVSAGQLDLALGYEYGLSPRDWPDELSRVTLLRENLVLLHTADELIEPDLAELADRRWITTGKDTAGARSLDRLCAAAGFAPSVAFRSDNYDVVRELVATSLGVAVVPALGYLPDPRVSATRVRHPAAYRTVTVSWRRANNNPLLAAAIAALRQAVPADEPYLTPVTESGHTAAP